jgi:hypothetical protein
MADMTYYDEKLFSEKGFMLLFSHMKFDSEKRSFLVFRLGEGVFKHQLWERCSYGAAQS